MKKIKKSESDVLEFKSCKGKYSAALPNDLWQDISAFTNTRGGSIYLGIQDDGSSEELDRSDIDTLQKDSSTLINGDKFNKRPDVQIVCHEGYVELIIAEAHFYEKPIYSRKLGSKEIYIRHGAATVRANEDQKKSMFAGATGGGENQLIEGDIDTLIDPVKIDDYINRTGLKDVNSLSSFDKLRKLKGMRNGKLTVFGLIAFGQSDTVDEQLNNTYIDFKYFNGKEKVSDNLDDIYKDRKEFHGNIKQQFDGAFSYLMRYIKSDWPVGGALNRTTGLREDVYVLPEQAFREALANAVAHRDYAVSNSCVNIDLYADRIEMTNPGESLVAIEDLDKTDSKARNPILMEFLKTFNVTDKSARGILTIKQAARKKGLLNPKFENISGSFKATLYFSSPYTDNDKIWLEENYGHLNLRDSQKNAIIFAKNNSDGVSNSEYCEKNHMNNRNDDKRARRELSQLVEYEILVKVGENRGSRYVINK